MSDFTSGFWSVFIIVITVGGLAGCVWLLVANNIKGADEVDVTGHVWDENLEEYDSPLPQWWKYLFYLTVVFAVGYLALYPGLGTFKGFFGWTSTGAHEAEMAKAEETYGPVFNKYLAMDVKAVAADPQAREMGQRLFGTYCAQCHGSDAKGSRSFPNLTDGDWLGAGDPEYIKGVIANGRMGVMPAMGSALDGEEIKDVAHYVRSLSGLAVDSIRLTRGKEIFNGKGGCVACHGPDAKGNAAIGAPNLTDGTWLYSSRLESVIETISQGRQNAMPAQADIVGSEAKIHLLAAYVWGLSNKPAK